VNWALLGINAAIFLFITMPLSSNRVDPSDPMLLEYLRHMAPSLPAFITPQQFLAQVSAYDLFVFSHGFKPGAFQFGDLFFSMFLHANFMHLAGNMLFLWIYGDNVEHRLGRIGYVACYLLTGIVATLVFSLFSGSSMVPMVGASGAISGVLGFYFLLFPRNKVKVFIFLFYFFQMILLPARWVIGAFIVFDNLLPVLVGAQSGVAYGAHIGGFFGGLGLAWLGERFNWRFPWSDRLQRIGGTGKRERRKSRPDAGKARGSLLSVVREAIAEQNFGGAVKAVSLMDKKEMAALKPRECISLASWLEQGGHPVAAGRMLRTCLSSHPGSKELSEVYLMLGLMRLRQGQPTAAYQHLLSVFDHNPSSETSRLAKESLSRINVYRKRR